LYNYVKIYNLENKIRMQIGSYVPQKKFSALGDKYCQRTGLPLILINKEGQEVYKLNECGLCLRIIKE